MKVLVIGATGGSGRAAVDELLRRGHEVTAFARTADRLGPAERLHTINGDATDPGTVDAAVPGHDAVIVTLGISENALKVRLFGSAGTPMRVRSTGTRHVIEAMRRHGVRRLVVQTSYGVGPTRHRLPRLQRIVFRLLLHPQIMDTERQDADVRASGLDWVIVQPVNLTNEPAPGRPFASEQGEVRAMTVARTRVGRFLADAAEGDDHIGRTVALSAAV